MHIEVIVDRQDVTVVPYVDTAEVAVDDLCVVAPQRVTFADVRKTVEKRAKYLESIRLFDYYQGGNLGEGMKSYAFRMSFRSPDGTLDDNSIDKVIAKVLGGLQKELQVSLRME